MGLVGSATPFVLASFLPVGHPGGGLMTGRFCRLPWMTTGSYRPGAALLQRLMKLRELYDPASAGARRFV